MIHYVISSVKDVTSIQADPHFIREFYPVEDCTELFKCTADFTTFSSHRFQKDRCMLIWAENAVQPLRNELNPYLRSLLHMASRMEIVEVSRNRLHALQVIHHGPLREIPDFFIR